MSGAMELSVMVTKIYKRLLLFPMPTIAAMNGHTFGAGAFISMCCDWRIMRKDCGRICFPEAKLGINISEGWRELISMKLTPQTARTALLTAKQYNTVEAMESKMIDRVIDTNQNNELFMTQCIAFGQELSPLGKNGRNYTRLKMDLYYPAVHGFENYNGISKL